MVTGQRWHEIAKEERYPARLQGASARFLWLKELSGLSHRRIAQLVSQRITVSGEEVEPHVAGYTVSSGTLNAIAKAAHGNHMRTLAALEVFFETPPGYFRVASNPQPTASFYKPGLEESADRDENEVWLMAARFSELDAKGRAAVNQIMDLIRAQSPQSTAGIETGLGDAEQDR